MRRSAFEIIYPKSFKWNTLADLREKYSKLRFPVCAHGSGDAPQEHDQAESDQIEAKKERMMTLSGMLLHTFAKRQKPGKFLLFLCLVLLAFASGCSYDGPPPADTPEPPAHNGVFRSEVGTLTFYGDGESITICFEDSFAAESDFPCGECEGTYAFKFHQKTYRYDKAEYLNIYIGEKEFSLRNNFQETNENIISVTSPVDVKETLKFTKIKTQN